jgi:hypothetical protein
MNIHTWVKVPTNEMQKQLATVHLYKLYADLVQNQLTLGVDLGDESDLSLF